MKKLLGLILAVALLCSGAVHAQAIGNGPGSLYSQLCGSGALAGGQFCNESGSSAPTNNCTVGAIVVLLGNGALYICTTTNTWTQLTAGSTYTAGTNIGLSAGAFSLASPLTTSLIVGPGTPTCSTAGYICSSASTSSGELILGGSSSRDSISFGVHHVGTMFLSPSSIDIGDGSTALMRSGCASTACFMYSETDALTGNAPMTFAGFGGAQGSTLNINYASTIATGPLQAASTSSAATTYVAPTYVAAGTAQASTFHCVQGTVTASTGSTTVTLTAPAAFADTTYWMGVEDFTALTQAVLTAQATGSFTFTSTNTQVYNYYGCGP